MKRITALLLTLIALATNPFVPVKAESTAVVIGEEEILKEGKLGEAIIADDVFSFTLTKFESGDKFDYRKAPGDSSSERMYSGDDYEFLYVWGSFINESLTSYTYDRYLSDIRLIFREKFIFESTNMQRIPNDGYMTPQMITIEPLVESKTFFVFKVPNIVATSKEPLTLQLFINATPYVVKLR